MAEKLVIDRFRNIAVTQGSADAFVQGTETTGISPSMGIAWVLTRLEVFFPQSNALQNVSADFSVHWSLTRDSKTAVSDFSDADCMAAGGFYGSLTTSGQIILPAYYQYEFGSGLLVVEPEVYFQLDSAATGLTLSPGVRLHYEEVKVSEVEILRMLTQG